MEHTYTHAHTHTRAHTCNEAGRCLEAGRQASPHLALDARPRASLVAADAVVSLCLQHLRRHEGRAGGQAGGMQA